MDAPGRAREAPCQHPLTPCLLGKHVHPSGLPLDPRVDRVHGQGHGARLPPLAQFALEALPKQHAQYLSLAKLPRRENRREARPTCC